MSRVSSTSGREGKAAHDQHVEHVHRLARRAAYQVVADRVVFGSNGNGGTLARAPFSVVALKLDEAAARGERAQVLQHQPLALLGVLHAGGLQIFVHNLGEIGGDHAALF